MTTKQIALIMDNIDNGSTIITLLLTNQETLSYRYRHYAGLYCDDTLLRFVPRAKTSHYVDVKEIVAIKTQRQADHE